MKRHRVCNIPAHFVWHTLTQAVCVWSKRWARISAGLRSLLDSCRWRRRRNYHSLMPPIDTAIRRRTTVKYHRPSTTEVLRGLYRTRSAHSRTICCSLYVFFFSQKYRSYTGINNKIIHTVHALSATYRKDRLTGGGAFYPGGLLTGSDWPGFIHIRYLYSFTVDAALSLWRNPLTLNLYLFLKLSVLWP